MNFGPSEIDSVAFCDGFKATVIAVSFIIKKSVAVQSDSLTLRLSSCVRQS